MLFTIEHEEASTPCPHDLAPEGTILLCLFIEPVDPGIRDFSRKILLCLPMFIKKVTELSKVAIFQSLLNLTTYLLDPVEGIYNPIIFFLCRLALGGKNLVCVS